MTESKFFRALKVSHKILFVKVLPQIVPFTFGDEQINLDNSIMVSCSIIVGDLPLNIWWRFTESDETMSYNLTSNDGVVITKPSQKFSILAIDAVKARLRGNYTCFASNKGGATQHSAYLAINGSNSLIFVIFQIIRILQFVQS